ncbi:14806_t:CDS:2 [Rhizophagus irregularis]|nr:14806_t:CDS:2 [Rhizophagus irregularis]
MVMNMVVLYDYLEITKGNNKQYEQKILSKKSFRVDFVNVVCE